MGGGLKGQEAQPRKTAAPAQTGGGLVPERELALWPPGQSQPLPVTVNRVLLARSHARSSSIVWGRGCYNGRADVSQQMLSVLQSLALYKKFAKPY